MALQKDLAEPQVRIEVVRISREFVPEGLGRAVGIPGIQKGLSVIRVQRREIRVKRQSTRQLLHGSRIVTGDEHADADQEAGFGRVAIAKNAFDHFLTVVNLAAPYKSGSQYIGHRLVTSILGFTRGKKLGSFRGFTVLEVAVSKKKIGIQISGRC